MLKTFILLIFLLSTVAHTETIKRSVFCGSSNPTANQILITEKLKKQKITFADAAFIARGDEDLYGEGTVLHEMGHAYWYSKGSSFQETFTDISWKRKGLKKYELKNKTSTNFVSAYAMTSPEEDFAEHFSSFVNKPEWLMTKSSQKYSILKKLIFPDVDYFTTVPDNAKIFVDSENPDTKPPWVSRTIEW